MSIVKFANTNNDEYTINQNYPNPFNQSTLIQYSVPKTGFVQIKVFNVIGKYITTLVNEEKQSGTYQVEFNGNNLSSGIYFYRMQADNYLQTKKFLLLK